VATTNFHGIGKTLVGESKSGQRTDYLSDGLGSVTGLGSAAALRNSYRYSPYGFGASGSGSPDDPPFLWLGSLGYRRQRTPVADRYVRARHYSSHTARWTSVDPLWPEQMPYAYASGSPATEVDPSGMVCEANTYFYEKRCHATRNMLDCCAARTSRILCDLIESARTTSDMGEGALSLGIKLTTSRDVDPQTFDCNGLKRLADATECQNDCMAKLWKARTTPLWRTAKAICAIRGEASFDCCAASVRAEQDGYTRCAPKCFSSLSGIRYSRRIHFAMNVLECCSRRSSYPIKP
jgi:RHS repeat-associated protein